MYIKYILCSEVDFSSNSTFFFFFNMELLRSVLTRSAYSEEGSRIKNNKCNNRYSLAHCKTINS